MTAPEAYIVSGVEFDQGGDEVSSWIDFDIGTWG
jgi:hypothetical protein